MKQNMKSGQMFNSQDTNSNDANFIDIIAPKFHSKSAEKPSKDQQIEVELLDLDQSEYESNESETATNHEQDIGVINQSYAKNT